MKTLLIATIALLSVGTANAGVIDPIGFASDFCASRQLGASVDDATETAVNRNYDDTLEAIKLKDGNDLDVVLGFEGVALLCPTYL